MRKSRRYQLLAKLEKLAEQKSLQNMVAAKNKLQEHASTGRTLAKYMRDYSDLNSGGGRLQSTGAGLRNGSRFVQNLAQAISIQQEQEKNAQLVFSKQNQYWLQAHARHQSMGSLSDEYRRQEQRYQSLAADQENEELWLTNRPNRTRQQS